MIIDTIENASRYTPLISRLKQALDWLDLAVRSRIIPGQIEPLSFLEFAAMP